MKSMSTLCILAFGLSMDAFAISICKGLALQKVRWVHMAIVGLWFGVFQALMPTVGYLLGTWAEKIICKVDHWVAFALLLLIGGNMLLGGGEEERREVSDASLSFVTMLPVSVATSVDALAVGITLPTMVDVGLICSVGVIGLTAFGLSFAGVKIGASFGGRLGSKAGTLGGFVLICLGIQILTEHLWMGT